jgi:hypothetical protein
MYRSLMLAAGGITAALTLGSAPAEAYWCGHGRCGGGFGVYVAPAPVYYRPYYAPYYAPQPVYYAPPPVYYAPPVVYAPPYASFGYRAPGVSLGVNLPLR